MASREKRPLAPSKSKQKANNETALPTSQNNRKRTQTTHKQQQLAREILEAVAGGSQLSPKLEASLPRKKVLRSLRRKQKLRNPKTSLVNVKVTKKVPLKNRRRIAVDAKKGVKLKTAKRLVEADRRASRSDEQQQQHQERKEEEEEKEEEKLEEEEVVAEANEEDPENGATIRKNSRAKKSKGAGRSSEEAEISTSNDQDTTIEAVVSSSSSKSSPKTVRKLKNNEFLPETPSKKAPKASSTKRTGSKEAETFVRASSVSGKSSSSSASSSSSYSSVTASPEARILKKSPTTNNSSSSVDLTIEEVVASMLSDTENEDSQLAGGKITRSRKMLIEDKLFTEIEIKKEAVEIEEGRTPSEETDRPQTPQQDISSSVQLRNRSSNNSLAQRSLRNGKLRQLTDSGISLDQETVKKRRWLNMDESGTTESGETSVDNVSDGTMDAESSFSESSGNDNHSGNYQSGKDDGSPIKLESLGDYDRVMEANIELENNNNSERIDRLTGEVGPILRSKTKAKSTDIEIKVEEPEAEDPTRPLGRGGGSIGCGLAGQHEPRKSGSLEQLRKENITKIMENKSPKSRRSSLNIDVKKTMSNFYGNDKTDNSSKSQIDQMIENIKLTIAKSIESKIFGPEKNLVRNKNFEVPKIEEIVAPLSAESQKLGLETERTLDEDETNPPKSDLTAASNSSDNSVPKLADTAKEIEKLVMGEIVTLVETQNSESAIIQIPGIEQQRRSDDPEDLPILGLIGTRPKSDKIVDDDSRNEIDAEAAGERITNEEDSTSDNLKEVKRFVVTRKSLRIKSSNENYAEVENSGKSSNDVERESSSIDEEGSKSDNASDDAGETIPSHEETSESVIIEAAENLMDSEVVPEGLPSSFHPETADKTLEVKKGSEEISIFVIPVDSETLESITKEVEDLVSSEVSLAKREKAEPLESEDRPVENIGTIGSKEMRDFPKLEVPESSLKLERIDASSSASEPTEIRETATSDTFEDETEKEDKIVESSVIDVILDKSSSKEVTESSQEAEEARIDSSKQQDQKITAEENRRVLRARDKLKKSEAKQSARGTEAPEATVKTEVETPGEIEETQESLIEERATPDEKRSKETENSEVELTVVKLESPEMPLRTRRSREVKRRKEESSTLGQNITKNKRGRKDVRKSDQRNKEETLLDNEVATINENNRSLVDKYDKVHGAKNSLRGFSEGGRRAVEKLEDSSESNRSKSENDIDNVKRKSECSERSSRQRAESDASKDHENPDGASDLESKITKSPETPQKDSDEASTSGESSSSLTMSSSKLDETPEDKAKKESILRLLGLESLEKAAERLNHQKARKEQYTGTLKTVIRVQKDKDKKRSRSPLKMVLKQGRSDGDGDSPEFYTIQKEFGTSGLGDSSSGANRKFSTNHRHSCDEDNDDAPPKDRQSLVIPEKSSSFSIHPGRLCADVCCYCFGKFGSLDTPMHLAQMKSDERRQKILSIEKHLNKDSCLCDACYRHVDRRANTSPTNMQTKPPRQHRQLMVSKCLVRDCREPARHHVKRRWLLKIKAVVQHQVDINWELSQHTSMSFCVDHYSKIEPFLTCALCKRRLAKNHTHPLAASETEELNQRLGRQGIPVHFVAGTFVCKLCRYFTQLHLKYKYSENMNASHRTFCKTYRVRILHCHDIEVFEAEEDEGVGASTSSKEKEKRKKAKCVQAKQAIMSKSGEEANNSASEKSTPEPTPRSSEAGNSEPENENQSAAIVPRAEVIGRDVQLMDLESTVEKLKKRKALEQLVYTTESSATTEPPGKTAGRSSNDVVEILAMDKEVTLTRLPKRPRVSNDITPVVQRLGANPSISVRTLFPGEEEMNLHASVEFANVREVTPQGWEKCATMIQYDRETKILWQELQRPYGNQSSFLRHLILLEKYYRSGDLVLAPNASRNAINYSTSVQNRLISYEGPEKMDEPITEPISSEYNSSRRMSGGYMIERDRLSLPSTSSNNSFVNSSLTNKNSGQSTTSGNGGTSTSSSSHVIAAAATAAAQTLKFAPSRVLKLTSGVSIIKKPPPSLQRLSLPSGSSSNGGASNTPTKRKEPSSSSSANKIPVTSGGTVFQLSEIEFRRLQNLKKQKQFMSEQKQSSSSNAVAVTNSPLNNAPINLKTTSASIASQYQKAAAQIAAQTQFQKHLRMQQEMLNRQTRGDFEPLICDVRSLANENTPTQNLINTLNLPKSIQVTTKPQNPIPILPKIPKSLTVIPQTVTRPFEK